MKIHLHIDELILHGQPVGVCDTTSIQAAVVAELARHLSNVATPADLPSDRTFVRERVTEIHLSGNDTPIALGQEIGQAIFGGISQ